MRLLLALIFLLSLAWAQRISPGDSLQFFCEAEASLSVTRVVGDLGYVDLPVVGKVLVGGKYVAEAESDISDLATRKLGGERVYVAITFVAGERTIIEYSGAVKKAGSTAYRQDLTLGEVLAQASPTGSAGLEAVEIVGTDGKKAVVDATSESGRQLHLKAGDKVFVPMASRPRDVFILGAVSKPGSVPFSPGMTLRDLIEKGGGMTAHAEGDIQLLRANGERAVLSPEKDSAFELAIGDSVTVPVTKSPKYVTVRGYVLKPGAVPFRKGMTLTEAIKEAGGLTIFARTDKVLVRRMGEAPYWTGQVELGKILAHEVPDFELHAADVVEVDHLPLKLPTVDKKEPRQSGGHPVVPPR